ncbi:unnamed protein product [Peronospora belbahrii]|uniref:N-acetyltransferase domain-containing protein n=1 Tax=Peronospora belbahrii TaxID=622444 RepID=A0AAU9L1I8_9STRA|nr:unnamed protein product [Peronospora belbahrii]
MELVQATSKTGAALILQTVRLENKHNTLILAIDTIKTYIFYRHNGTEGHINRIAVAKNHQRQEIGRSLLQYAIATLRTKRQRLYYWKWTQQIHGPLHCTSHRVIKAPLYTE